MFANHIQCDFAAMQLTSSSNPSQGYMAGPGRSYQQQLFSLVVVDDRDELGERLEKDFSRVLAIQNGVSENEGRDKLANQAQQSTAEFVEIMDGLLYGILTDASAAEKYMADVTTLSLLNGEAFGPIMRTLSTLITEKFSKLSEPARNQGIWLLKTFTRKGVPNLERVYIPWMRNLTVGEHWKSIPLIENTIEMLGENRTFLDNPTNAPIIQMAVLTLIQLIQYHHTSLQYSVIKDKEMDFCLELLRTKLNECLQIGKELVRSLMQISKMPKMKDFWNELVTEPQKLAPTLPNFSGVPHLLQLRTSRWMYSHRITPDLETKINFILRQVRAAQVPRYAEIFVKQVRNCMRFSTCHSYSPWDLQEGQRNPTQGLLFQSHQAVFVREKRTAVYFPSLTRSVSWYLWEESRERRDVLLLEFSRTYTQYLAVSESDILLPEIIRFVCRSIHPSNEILGSDVLQRWNFVFILLNTCKTPTCMNHCLLALFYDWMLFNDPVSDNNIMNIEPAILLLMNVLQKPVRVFQKLLVVSLVEYLCRIPFDFFAPITPKIRAAVVASFRYILQKGVVSSFVTIIDSVPEEQKAALRKSYPEIFANDPLAPVPVMNGSTPSKSDLALSLPSQAELLGSRPDGKEDSEEPPPTDLAEPVSASRPIPKNASHMQSRPMNMGVKRTSSTPTRNLEQHLNEFPAPLQNLLIRMRDNSLEDKCAAMEQFVADAINQGLYWDTVSLESLAAAFSLILRPLYEAFRLPSKPTEENIEDSVQSPLFIIFRRLWEEENGTECRQRVTDLIVELNTTMPMLGFLLIYFMIYKRPRNLEDREWMADYEDFHNHNCMRWLRSELTVSAYAEYIAHDLELCGQHDHALLTYLVPFIYRECPRISKDCPMIFRAIIAYLDASEIMSLVCAISQKKMVMLSDKGCTDVIKESLKWETIEQNFFWKLVMAHELKTDNLVKEVVGEISFQHHPEATVQILEMLKEEAPREELVREVFRRDPAEVDNSPFITICIQWTKRHSSMLAESIGKLIAKSVGQPKKRALHKPNMVTKNEITPEQVLGHLDILREYMVATEHDSIKRIRETSSALVQLLFNQHIQLALDSVKATMANSLKEKYRDVLLIVSDHVEEEKKAVAPKPKGTAKRSRPKTGAARHRDSESERSEEDEEIAVVATKPKKSRHKSPPVTTLD